LNAGTFIPVSAHELNYETFDNTMNVNFIGVVNCLLPAVEAMKKAGKGQLAIVASVAGYGGLKKSASYGASKAALINMAESLKFDLDAMNIKIQIVTPGFIDTPLTEKNKFKMPFLMSASDAAERIIAGLKKDRFEITFPRRFTFMLKFANILPYFLYFRIMGSATRSRK
jgi:short-subunit dehydrogenase